MKHRLHTAPGNRELVLFFHGWSMDDHALPPLDLGGRDWLVLWDYTTLDGEIIIPEYPAYHLLAWSLGVRAAAEFPLIREINFTTSTAINGTLQPVDERFGIAPTIFWGTIDNWLDPAARERFYRRVGGTLPLPQRSPESQQEELIAIAARAAQPVPNPFRRAFVGRRDRIFPPENQLAAWPEAEIFDWPHSPFGDFTEISNLAFHR